MVVTLHDLILEQEQARDEIARWQGLALRIIQSAVDDVQCERCEPMCWCRKERGLTSCPLCRELALIDLESVWIARLAEFVGIKDGVWQMCLRELSKQARSNNQRSQPRGTPRSRVAASVAWYIMEHPRTTWDEIYHNVEHHYRNVDTLSDAMNRLGLKLSEPELVQEWLDVEQA